MIDEDDDFMNQEQYIIEFPDHIAEMIRSDQNFDYDLQFDETGLAGTCKFRKPNEQTLLFRIFALPLVTESYTSTNGDMFYKNADIGQMIIVYDPERPPAIFDHYESFAREQCRRAAMQLPVYDVLPSGLTPPSAQASAFYPELPTRPKLFEQAYWDTTDISFKDGQGPHLGEEQNEIKQLEQQIANVKNKLTDRQHRLKQNNVDPNDDAECKELSQDIRTKENQILILKQASARSEASKGKPRASRAKKE